MNRTSERNGRIETEDALPAAAEALDRTSGPAASGFAGGKCGVEEEVVDGGRVLREIARIAFADPRELMTWGPDGIWVRPSGEISDDVAALVSEVREGRDGVTLKLLDKSRALELLGKHLGLFKDKVEMSGELDMAEQLMEARERLARLR